MRDGTGNILDLFQRLRDPIKNTEILLYFIHSCFFAMSFILRFPPHQPIRDPEWVTAQEIQDELDISLLDFFRAVRKLENTPNRVEWSMISKTTPDGNILYHMKSVRNAMEDYDDTL